MNLKRIKTTFAAGVLAASMIMPSLAVCAAPSNPNNVKTVAGDATSVITKIVKSPEGVDYTNKEFEFKFTPDTSITEESGIQTSTSASITIPNAKVTVSSTDAQADSTASNDNVAKKNLDSALDLSKIVSPGLYIYTVEEATTDSTENNVTWKANVNSNKYRMRVYATWAKDGNGNNTDTLEKKITLIALDASGSETGNKLDSAEFTNTLTKTTSFILEKKLSDNDGLESKDQTYEFEVTITPSTLGATTNPTYTVTVDGQTQTVTWNDGKATIKLSSGQKAEFSGVLAGSTISVEEKNNPANVDSLQVKYVNGAKELGSNPTALTKNENLTGTNAIVLDEDGAYVQYDNTWKTLTVTGVVTDIAPYITLVVVAVAAIAAYIGFKKRIAR